MGQNAVTDYQGFTHEGLTHYCSGDKCGCVRADSPYPVLLAVARGEDWRAWCPFCRAWHIHGPGAGHRVAHCSGGPLAETGYVIKLSDEKGYGYRPVRRDGLNPKDRFAVLQRDNFTCQYCGRRPPAVKLTVDHRVAVAKGGSLRHPDNLCAACEACNAGKGAR